MMRRKQPGSITPFLTLILILMMAMLGTLLEAARVQIGENIAKEALNTAIESELSQFYLPLYEDYHLFFMERGIDTEQLEQKELLESIQEYILYTFDADHGLTGSSLHLYSDFYGLELQNAKISRIVRATEYNGSLLRAQAVEYSKYSSSREVLDSFSKQLEMVEKSRKASEIIEKKLETEESLAEVSSKILELIELVEGVSCNKKKTAFTFTKAGGLKSEKEFAKKFCPDTVTAAHVGVENTIVWNLLKNKYQTPVAVLKEAEGNMKHLERNLEKIEQLSKETEIFQKKVTELEGKLQQKNEEKAAEEEALFKLQKEKKELEKESNKHTALENVEEKADSFEFLQEQIEISEKKIENLSKAAKKIEEDIDKNLEKEHKVREEMQQKNEYQETSVEKINNSIQLVAKQAEKVYKAAEKAVGVIPKLKEKQSQVQGKLQEYKTIFSNSKDDLTEELKKGLQKDLEELERYAAKEEGKNSYITRLVNMKPVLEKNIEILKQVIQIADIKVSLEDLEECKNQRKKIEQVINSFKDYRIDTLKFDYSTLQIKSDMKNPIDSMSDSLTSGVLEMVLPQNVTLSNRKLSKADYYYLNYAKSTDKNVKNAVVDYGKSLEKAKQEGYQSDITTSFGFYGNGKNSMQKNSKELLEKMLFEQYCTEHFKSFTDVIEKKGQETGGVLKKEKSQIKKKDTVLEYEQEYLLAGKATDKDNLKAIIHKIIFIRTIMNFVYLMTDIQKKEITYATAAALVGLTGLEPLVRLTQTTILLTWAYEEALVDVAALLTGKSIPFIKDKTTFLLRYEEMFGISKTIIQEKASMVKDNKAALSMKYKDYLQVFLVLEAENKKSYRVMDLIEENLRKRNSNNFSFFRAIYGMDVSVDVFMKPRFLQIPMVQSFTKWKGTGWKFFIQQSHAY